MWRVHGIIKGPGIYLKNVLDMTQVAVQNRCHPCACPFPSTTFSCRTNTFIFFAVYLYIAMYSVGASLPISCSFKKSASSYVWSDEEDNEVYNGQNITFSFNDSVHHKRFTCKGNNATSVVGFEHIKLIVNGNSIQKVLL